MKVSAQPLSAFAVYSEKLKQKKKKPISQVSNGIKKKGKPQVSNGIKKKSKPHVTNSLKKKLKLQVSNNVNKLKKAQLSNALNKPKNDVDKKTLEMKEIGYILKKLTEKSADTSSPRATALLNSISEANEKLEHDHTDDGMYLEEILQNVIEVESLKKKARYLKNLNKKKVNKPVAETVLLGDDFLTGHSKLGKLSSIENPAVSEKNCELAESSTKTFLSSGDKSLDTSKSKSSKLKKKKATSNKEAIGLSLKTELLKKKKLSPVEKVKKRRTLDQLEIMARKRSREEFQREHKNTSIDSTAKQLFDWLIVPVSEKDFMSDFWEKQPLLIQREGNRNYFSELLSTERIDLMLRENNVCFTKHLDITSYTDGVRETHNLTGRAQASVVWDFYSNGCSVRMLNPQIFLPKIHTLNATLQEYFGCFVGANVYLTPPNSQGFAPHYDDIEAFVLQIEGKKHWKVYTPRTDNEVLPRLSSPNFSQEEIGEPFLDVTLEPGDLLYFPRGFIHQASTVEGEHSLHITLSAYQKTAWVDLLEKVLPIALKKAAENEVEFRRGLPRDYLGLEHRGSPREQESFVDTTKTLIRKLGDYIELSLGAGVDEMGRQFMHDALPPVFTPSEKQNSSVGRGLKMKNGKLEGRVAFQLDTRIKLIRRNICRLVEQEGEVRLYHCLDNSLEYHGDEPQFLILPREGLVAITQLQFCYPAFIPISEIPHTDEEAMIAVISDLWETGLLLAEDLPVVEET